MSSFYRLTITTPPLLIDIPSFLLFIAVPALHIRSGSARIEIVVTTVDEIVVSSLVFEYSPWFHGVRGVQGVLLGDWQDTGETFIPFGGVH